MYITMAPVNKPHLHTMSAARLQVRSPSKVHNPSTTLHKTISPPQPTPLLEDPTEVDMINLPNVVVLSPQPYQKQDNPEIAGKLFHSPNYTNKQGLVLMVHGVDLGLKTNGFEVCYNHIGKYSASMGFIAVSIKHKQIGALQAEFEIIENVKYVMDLYGDTFGLFGKELSLIGHSEGALGAIYAGLTIQNGGVSDYFSTVRAIVAFAPPGHAITPQKLGYCSTSLLVLQGTHDDDSPVGGFSLVPFFGTNPPFKSFMWLHGCNHEAFLEGTFGPPFPQTNGTTPDDLAKLNKSSQTQYLLAKNYATMFLLWQHGINTLYKKIFTGESVVKFTSPLPTVQNDLDHTFRAFPLTRQRHWLLSSVVRFIGFYKKPWIPIDPVEWQSSTSLELLEFTCTHQPTTGFVVWWNRTLANNPSIIIPCNPDIMASIPINSLEFDAILVANSINAAAPARVTIGVMLQDQWGFAKVVDVAIEPALSLTTTAKYNGKTIARSVLSTIKIRILLFQFGARIKHVTHMHILFSSAPTLGRVALSSFRVTL